MQTLNGKKKENKLKKGTQKIYCPILETMYVFRTSIYNIYEELKKYILSYMKRG